MSELSLQCSLENDSECQTVGSVLHNGLENNRTMRQISIKYMFAGGGLTQINESFQSVPTQVDGKFDLYDSVGTERQTGRLWAIILCVMKRLFFKAGRLWALLVDNLCVINNR